MSSTDEGLTWSKKERLPDGLLGPIRAKLLILHNGTVVAGSSVEKTGSWTAWIERSTDNANTFTHYGPITVSKEADKGPRKYEGIIQPSVIDVSKPNETGHLRTIAWTGREGRRSGLDGCWEDLDAGPVYRRAAEQLRAGCGAAQRRARGDDFNDTTVGRTPLNLAVSTDGEHFRTFATLEDTEGQFSYPALVEFADGGLEMTYTWKRKTIKYIHLSAADIPRD